MENLFCFESNVISTFPDPHNVGASCALHIVALAVDRIVRNISPAKNELSCVTRAPLLICVFLYATLITCSMVEYNRIIVHNWFYMETNRLRQFIAVSQTLNLRKSAEFLNMSHSALSKSLKVLQEQLQIKLLIQEGRNIQLTEEGQNFISKAVAMIRMEDNLMVSSTTTSNIIKIGTFEVFSTHLLGKTWSKYFPDYQLELRELVPGPLENAVLERHVDIGISYEPIPTSGLEFILVGQIKMGIFGVESLLREPTFKDLPFVVPATPLVGSPTGVKGLDGWPNLDFPRFVKFKVDMMESGLALARAGKAAIYLPEFVARHHNEVVAKRFSLIPISGPVKMKLVKRKIYLIRAWCALS